MLHRRSLRGSAVILLLLFLCITPIAAQDPLPTQGESQTVRLFMDCNAVGCYRPGLPADRDPVRELGPGPEGCGRLPPGHIPWNRGGGFLFRARVYRTGALRKHDGHTGSRIGIRCHPRRAKGGCYPAHKGRAHEVRGPHPHGGRNRYRAPAAGSRPGGATRGRPGHGSRR